MTATPSEGIKISELTTLTKGASDYVAGSQSGASGKFLLNDYTFNITAGMTWTQIAAVFDQAKAVGQIGHSVIIQFASSTAYTQTADYTFTNMGRIRILGLDGDTVDATMAVKLTTTTYKLNFVNCGDSEFKYVQVATSGNTGSYFNLTNTFLNTDYCYLDGDAGDSVFVASSDIGSHFLIQRSTVNNFYQLGVLNHGVWQVGSGNTISLVNPDPAFSNNNGTVIDQDGTYVEADLSASVTGYRAFGKTISAGVGGTVRARYFKSDDYPNASWVLSMLSSDASVSTLADYEEGNWTPTLVPTTGAFGTIVYDALTLGRYVKVGRTCHLQGTIRTDSVPVGTASGDLKIGGLPYAATSSIFASGSISQSALWDTNDNPLACEIIPSTATIQLYKRTTFNGDSTPSQVADLILTVTADRNFIRFSVTYTTST